MRLPTYFEVVRLAADEQQADSCAFQDIRDGYWTSSEGEYGDSYWAVSFVCGCSPSAKGRTGRSSVRCVAEGKP